MYCFSELRYIYWSDCCQYKYPNCTLNFFLIVDFSFPIFSFYLNFQYSIKIYKVLEHFKYYVTACQIATLLQLIIFCISISFVIFNYRYNIYYIWLSHSKEGYFLSFFFCFYLKALGVKIENEKKTEKRNETNRIRYVFF